MTPEPVVERKPLPEIEARLEEGRLIFLLLDYDGTLVPICNRPEEAVPGPGLVDVLSRLSRRPDVKVAVLSGRALEEVARLLPVEGMFVVGCHGAEMQGPRGWRRDLVDRGEFRRQVEPFLDEARRLMEDVQGALIEDKGLAISFHTRLAARDDVPDLLAGLEDLRSRFLAGRQVAAFRGKEIWEVRPAGVDKGRAAMILLDEHGGDAPFPVAIGDDRTDQDAFAVVQGRGLSILVSPGWDGAMADLRLSGPRAVQDLLDKIAGQEKYR